MGRGRGKRRARRTRRGPRPSEPSPLEGKFDLYWRAMNGPPLGKELKLIPGRQFAFDRGHLPSRVLIEIHGGVYIGGRHTRGKGFESDREKMELANDLGYRVFELTPSRINWNKLAKILRVIRERTGGADVEGDQSRAAA